MTALNKMREEMRRKFIDALRAEKIPWEKEWSCAGRPVNPVSHTTYRGVNCLWLWVTMEEKGYDDPRFLTFKQASEKGWSVKKGEKGTKIEFWSMYDTLTKRKLSREESYRLARQMEEKGDDPGERIKPVSSVYTVFNAEQIEGIPEIETDRYTPDKDLLLKRDRLIKEMGVGFLEGHGEAAYLPKKDLIKMPAPGRFKDPYAYMSTFLHEAGHATGAKHRMDRDLENSFGTEGYAKEELRAEIASAFTAHAIGIKDGGRIRNHKAYIQSWIQIIEDKPSELFAAIRDAEKISDYLIEKGGFDVINSLEEEKEEASDAENPEEPRVKNTVVINAFGGAGAGKTTACLHIAAELKKRGYVAEYVPEYAKELVWDKNFALLDGSEESQRAILKEQEHRLSRLMGQVDFAVTDAPVLLNGIYLNDCPGKAEYCRRLLEKFNSYTNFNLVIQRDPSRYETEGRLQSLEESMAIDGSVTGMLRENGIYFGVYDHSKLDVIVSNAVRTHDRAASPHGDRAALPPERNSRTAKTAAPAAREPER